MNFEFYIIIRQHSNPLSKALKKKINLNAKSEQQSILI